MRAKRIREEATFKYLPEGGGPIDKMSSFITACKNSHYWKCPWRRLSPAENQVSVKARFEGEFSVIA